MKILAFLLVVVMLFGYVPNTLAGAPYPPEWVSPASGSTSSNPPTLVAKNAGDPEGDAVKIRFECNYHASPWISVGGKGSTATWTDSTPWAAGDYQCSARAEAAGEQSGASNGVTFRVPAPPQQASCTVDTLTVSPPPPQAKGVILTIFASGSCTNGVQRLRFLVDGGRIGKVDGSQGTVSWNTSGASVGDHVIGVEIADNDAGFINSRTQTYLLTEGAPPPPPNVSCSVNGNVFPGSPKPPGTIVTIQGTGSCNTGVRSMRVKIDGGVTYEIGAPNLSWDWNTSGTGGDHRITIEIAGLGDDGWHQSAKWEMVYSILSSAPPPAQPSFGNCEVVQVGSDLFVMVGGSRRLVPNPASLDALGIPRAWVNNKGLSDGELSRIPRGQDIPDVNWDRAGFDAFKAACFPNTTPIVPGTSEGNGNISPPPVENNKCASVSKNLSPGVIGVVTSELNVRTLPGLGNGVFFILKKYDQVSIISGPVCKDSNTWWEVGFQGKSGWLSDVNLILNGTPFPSQVDNSTENSVGAPSSNSDVAGSVSVNVVSSGQTGGSYHGWPFNPPNDDSVKVVVNSLRIRSGPSTDDKILGFVVNGESYPVIEKNGDWSKIQTASGIQGWIYLPGYTEGRQVSNAPAAQIDPNQFPFNVNAQIVCNGEPVEQTGAVEWILDMVSGEVYAREPRTTPYSDPGQCVAYVYNEGSSSVRPDVIKWVGYGNADEWVDMARESGLGQFIDHGLSDPLSVQNGDIVVWTQECSSPPTNHVAIVVDITIDGIIVNESNRNGDGKIHTNAYYKIDKCMYFIHKPDSEWWNAHGGAPENLADGQINGQGQIGIGVLPP